MTEPTNEQARLPLFATIEDDVAGTILLRIDRLVFVRSLGPDNTDLHFSGGTQLTVQIGIEDVARQLDQYFGRRGELA